MKNEERQERTAKPQQKSMRGPDRREIDRRRGGRRANKLFHSDWAFYLLIGVCVFLGSVITIQNQRMKSSYQTIEILHQNLLEQTAKDK